MLFLLVSLIISAVCGQVTVPLGYPFSVTGGAWNNVTVTDGASDHMLSIWSAVTTNVTLDEYSNVTDMWNNLMVTGITSLGVGNYSAWIFTTQYATTLKIQWTFPPLPVAALGPLTAPNTVATLMKYDPVYHVATRIVTTYDPLHYTLEANPTGAGVYFTAYLMTSVTINKVVGGGGSAWTAGWANQTYRWSVQMPGDLAITFDSAVSNTITVLPLSVDVVNISSKIHPLNIWFEIDVGDNSQAFSATISVTWTMAQVQNIFGMNADPSQLSLGWFDSTSGDWKFPASGGFVDTFNQRVVLTIGHISSKWGVFLGLPTPVLTPGAAASLHYEPLVVILMIFLALLF